MKLNLTWLTLLILIVSSCGREALKKKAPKEYLPVNGILSQSLTGKSFDPNMRSMTLLIYPRAKDVVTFQYRPKGNAITPWQTSLNDLSYGDQIVQKYTKEMPGALKVSKMVAAILSVGESRDKAFKKAAPLKNQAKKFSQVIKEKNSALKKRLKPFKCYYVKKPNRGQTYDCRLNEGESRSQKKSLRSCRDLKKYSFVFSPDEQEREAEFGTITSDCADLSQQREELGVLKEEIENYNYIRKSGESVVLDLLQSAEQHTGKKVFVAVGASKEKVNEEDEKSTLIIDPETRVIQGLKLLIDFGLNYSGGSGYQEYSTDNGKIQNFRLEKRGKADVLKFTLETLDFTIEAALSMTIQDFMDLRFVGEIQTRYPDGSVARGAMKLEFDRVY